MTKTLPSYVWLVVCWSLSLKELLRLSSVSRELLYLVDTVALQTYFLRHYSAPEWWVNRIAFNNKQDQRSRWFNQLRYLAQVDQAWRQPCLSVSNVKLPIHIPSSALRVGSFHAAVKTEFSIPRLVIATDRLVVAIRSQLYIFDNNDLAFSELDFAHAKTISLRQATTTTTTAANPWHDVTSMKKMDNAANQLVIGYADGRIETLDLQLDQTVLSKVTTSFHLSRERWEEIRDVDCTGVVTRRTIVSVSKRGRMRVFWDGLTENPDIEWQIEPDGRLSNNESIVLTTRTWCLHLDSNWLAVGVTGHTALYVYRFDSSTKKLDTNAILLDSGGSKTSVFAITTSNDTNLLYAGFYDGVIRVYSTVDFETNSSRIHPLRVLTDDLERAPIYSLAISSAGYLIVGSNRHSRARIVTIPFTTTDNAGGGYSIYTVPKSPSPQYSIVADRDRVYGVTDRYLWILDYGSWILPSLCSSSTTTIQCRNSSTFPFPSIPYFDHKLDAFLHTLPPPL